MKYINLLGKEIKMKFASLTSNTVQFYISTLMSDYKRKGVWIDMKVNKGLVFE